MDSCQWSTEGFSHRSISNAHTTAEYSEILMGFLIAVFLMLIQLLSTVTDTLVPSHWGGGE